MAKLCYDSSGSRRQFGDVDLSDNSGMDRDQLREYAHSLVDELSQRQLEAVVGVLQCITGRDESDGIPETAAGEGIPPGEIFGKFFS